MRSFINAYWQESCIKVQGVVVQIQVLSLNTTAAGIVSFELIQLEMVPGDTRGHSFKCFSVDSRLISFKRSIIF